MINKDLSRLNDIINEQYPRAKNGRAYLGAGVISVLIVLLILLIGCFAALTFVTADNKAQLADKSARYCTNYYAAETVASELLNTIAHEGDNKGKSGKKTEYDTDAGTIVVTKADNFVSFKVAINKSQDLNVEANINDKKIKILTWNVE